MNYIVFDLEWNQSPVGKEQENSRIPFEIIEIGAVKLNHNFEILGEFHRLIKPVIYKELNFHTQNVIQSDMEEFQEGISFGRAAEEFLEWCGKEYMFCSWGNIDLVELQRNMKYYHKLDLLKGPIRYYDAQKLFSLKYEDERLRRALRYAVDYLEIPLSREFHRALGDAFYTAMVFRKFQVAFIEQHFSIDTYQNPKSKKDEIYVIYDNYSKYVSREFTSKDEAMLDRQVVSSKCFHCRKNLKKKVRWFCANAKNYYCIAFCPKHGYFKGKIRMKRTDEGNYYVIKTMRMVSEEEALEIKIRQDSLRLKRLQKRHSKMN